MRKENRTSYRRLFMSHSCIYFSCFPLIPSVHKRCNHKERCDYLIHKTDVRMLIYILDVRTLGPEISRTLCVKNRYDGEKRL
jgi:hypothetical protein